MKIFYLCDRRACEKCAPECRHTPDIRHAVNFEMQGESIRELGRCELISEETLELPGVFIDDERLEKIEGYLARLVDAQGKAAELPQANIQCDGPSEIAREIGKRIAEAVSLGLID